MGLVFSRFDHGLNDLVGLLQLLSGTASKHVSYSSMKNPRVGFIALELKQCARRQIERVGKGKDCFERRTPLASFNLAEKVRRQSRLFGRLLDREVRGFSGGANPTGE